MADFYKSVSTYSSNTNNCGSSTVLVNLEGDVAQELLVKGSDPSKSIKSSCCWYTNEVTTKHLRNFVAVAIALLIIILLAFVALDTDSNNNSDWPTLPKVFCGTSKLNNLEYEEDAEIISSKITDFEDYYYENLDAEIISSDKENIDYMQKIENKIQIQIEKIEDLKYISPGAQSVKIKSLIGHEARKLILVPEAAASVTELTIAGPISPDWLHEMASKMPSLRKLTLSMDAFCLNNSALIGNEFDGISDDKNEKLNLNLMEIIFKNVTDFHVINNLKECTLHPWIFSWKFTKLQKLKMYNMDLKTDVFSSVHNFLEANKETLRIITVSNCYICEECYISDVNYSHIEMIRILQQRANTTFQKLL